MQMVNIKQTGNNIVVCKLLRPDAAVLLPDSQQYKRQIRALQ